MKRLLIMTICAAAAGPGFAETLTFQQALSRALQVNNTVERSRAEVGVAEQNRKFLLSQVLPRVTATGSSIRNTTQVAFGSGADSRVILPESDWNYRVVLAQPIYAGLRERRAYDQAKIGVSNAEQGVLQTEDAVLLRVASNFFGVADADARINIEKQNIALAEKRRQQASAFYQAGEVTKVDVLRAETAIKAAQRLLAVAQQNREEAASRLRADLDLSGTIEVAPPAQPLPPLPDEQTLVARAEASRPDVAQAQNNVRAAQLEVQKQKGYWWPVVTFDAGYINQKSAFPANRLLQSNRPADAALLWQQATQKLAKPIPPDVPGSVLWDGGFEASFSHGGLGWFYESMVRGVQIQTDTQEKHSGAQSLRLLFAGRSNISFSEICHVAVVEPGKSYQLSGWVQTKRLTTDQGVRFVLYSSSNGKVMALATPEVHGDAPWTPLSLLWTAPPDAQTASVCVARYPSDSGNGEISGIAWIDDVALVPVTSERQHR